MFFAAAAMRFTLLFRGFAVAAPYAMPPDVITSSIFRATPHDFIASFAFGIAATMPYDAAYDFLRLFSLMLLRFRCRQDFLSPRSLFAAAIATQAD